MCPKCPTAVVHNWGASRRENFVKITNNLVLHLLLFAPLLLRVCRILHPIELPLIPKSISDGKRHNNNFMVRARAWPQLWLLKSEGRLKYPTYQFLIPLLDLTHHWATTYPKTNWRWEMTQQWFCGEGDGSNTIMTAQEWGRTLTSTEFRIPMIQFPFLRWDAFEWKDLVFLSPSLNHKTFDS